jgi:hypothetical protein
MAGVKRWQVEFDGVSGGHIYADTLDAARRAAQAAYARVYPERDASKGLVQVKGEGQDVTSEILEAKTIVDAVYEGLRLLPGMEVPAEKLRGAVLLLEHAAALEGAIGAGRKGDKGDDDLLAALGPILEAKTVPSDVKSRVKGLAEWIGVNTPEADRRKVELKLFMCLWEAGLIDLRFAEPATCALHRASAFLTKKLVAAGALRLDRFEGARLLADLRPAIQKHGKEAVVTQWSFVAPDEAETVQVLRPLALLGDQLLQPAVVLRGVGNPDPEVVEYDRSLFDALTRLRLWTDGLGRLAEPHFTKEAQQQLLPRTKKRLEDVRQTMAKAAQDKQPILPTETLRRDVVQFLIDQTHRLEDALAYLADRSLRDAFAEVVSKDLVFRGAGAYLSKRLGINIDTDVVVGADTSELAGKFKLEPGGPKPKAQTRRIHSVVVPCYTRDGVAVRPASVRTGDYGE